MPEYTLKIRRYQPESGEGPYWEEFKVELEDSLSVLDGILQAKDREDGSLAVRCSCRAAICGSCGVKVNGQSTLACKTQIGHAHAAANRRNGGSEPIVGEPRDAETRERLYDLAQDPHGMYDCTHCFNCIDACPKGVAPMDQIMRLRRRATRDEEIVDQNN